MSQNTREVLFKSIPIFFFLHTRNLGSDDSKYRQVKVTSNQFQRILGGKSGSSQILQAAGFDTQEGDFLKLSRHDLALLYLISSIVENTLEVVEKVTAFTASASDASVASASRDSHDMPVTVP